MSSLAGEPIAIVGSACRFAGNASSASKLWDILKNPHDLRREIPNDRFSARGFYHRKHTHLGHSNISSSYLLNDDLSVFDAEFFGIKPVEVKAVDPQQRLLMEVVYEGLEAAGLSFHRLRGSDTSVYVGVMCNDYESMLLRDLEAAPTYFATGTSRSIMSNRISYYFDWHGPSVTIDTACSSSLVAVHMAIQTLRAGNSQIAVACGSNLILGPENYIIESKLKMLSPDGVCRMWDQEANGYARGDGVAAVILKPLSAALADGDHVECIIRETSVNQDGATTGITIPSASAQRALIRDTYAKAGLRPLDNVQDRPQYFEAHGTGTPAGDPAEAEAIYSAFFENRDTLDGESSFKLSPNETVPLLVGSIKTVLGHTEGTAGLAGILKASLALQHSTIPPNLHFHNLSNRVAPFYRNLQIPSEGARPWPTMNGVNRHCNRASVNSFGFGGTNAHAILESYCNSDLERESSKHAGPLFTPFVFSANSELSLRANLAAYLSFLNQDQLPNIHDLAWTLRQRRTLLAHRVYFAAESLEDLRQQIISHLQDDHKVIGARFANVTKAGERPRNEVLGVFTGQGAQFARFGAELIEKSPFARRIMLELEAYLASLPADERPSWSLINELLASSTKSRLNEAAIAQPLCTAVQILLVDLLDLAGIHFSAVVGHSSGEIAAAYAAGIISARDALLIAYFRGVHTNKAVSPNGQHVLGAMLAVGTSMEDAQSLCDDEVYRGRLTVAACNSSSSTTISGDEDAIEELQELLEDEQKFHRRLRVDKAYHSRHMDPCFAPYVQSLQRCGVRTRLAQNQENSGRCRWFSSVSGRLIQTGMQEGLENVYWAENMTQPVLFTQALTAALTSAGGLGYKAVLEVGPHPALQGPACQTVEEVIGKKLPYHSTLLRNVDAVTAFSSSLGFLWQHTQLEHTQNSSPNLDIYERAMTDDGRSSAKKNDRCFKVVKNLPPYQWNHSSKYWSESRISRRMRLRQDIYHPLLGHSTPDSSKHHLRWRNVLRPDKASSETTGNDEADALNLEGHRVQGQIVFPAAGYVATALEAARNLTPDYDASTGSLNRTGKASQVRLIDIHDMVIHQAMVMSSDKIDEGIEVLIELADIVSIHKTRRVQGRFTYSAALKREDRDALTLVASARVEAVISDDAKMYRDVLPPRRPALPHMVDVEKERFYSSLSDLGYQYEGAFRSMTALKRKHGQATCVVDARRQDRNECFEQDNGPPLLASPSELDAAFQSLLLAYSYPGDDQLRHLHLPQRIGHIRVNPALFGSAAEKVRLIQDDTVHGNQNTLSVHAVVRRSTDHSASAVSSLSNPRGGFGGDITIFTETSPFAAIQVRDVQLVPLEGSTDKSAYRKLFTKMQWVEMAPNGSAAAALDNDVILSPWGRATLTALERLAAFYLRQFDEQVPHDSPLRSRAEGDATAFYLQYAQRVSTSIPAHWQNDTLADIHQATEICANLPDVRLMHLVGETMPCVFRGETSMLEAFRETRLLDDYYVHGFSPAPSGRWQSQIVEQIAVRHPHLNMLEIGAGTGGTTKPILDALGARFQTYTFTDISAGFFGDAATSLSSFQDRLSFRTLDIENDPCGQGFREGAYDVVIASFVLHATASLSRTLANVRKLLRPGGFLVVGEGSLKTPASSFIFGPLSGWWLGRHEGRMDSPHVSTTQWDDLLRQNGFSGIDTKPPDEWEDILGVSLFVSQATDPQVQYLRSPFIYPLPLRTAPAGRIVLVGGQTPEVARLMHKASVLLQPFAKEILSFASFTDVDFDRLMAEDDPHTAVMCLIELDKPIYQDMTEVDFTSIRQLFGAGKTLLWVTTNRLSKNPFSNMMLGFGRTAANEIAGLHLQQLDIATPQDENTAKILSETLLRLLHKPTSTDKNGDQDILWTVEPEILVRSNGHNQVPRLLPLEALNNRYNSGRRSITKDVDIGKVAVAIKHNSDGAVALEKLSPTNHNIGSKAIIKKNDQLEVRITHATAYAFKSTMGHKFLALGIDMRSEARYLILVSSLASIVKVSKEHMTLLKTDDSSTPTNLFYAANHLLAHAIVSPSMRGATVLVHNASKEIAEIILMQAKATGVNIVFISDKNEPLVSNLEIKHLPNYLSRAELWALLPDPGQIRCFVTFTSLKRSSESRDMILANLPAWCHIESVDTLYSTGGCESDPAGDSTLLKYIEHALERAQEQNKYSHAVFKTIDLDQLVGNSQNFAHDRDSHDINDADDCDNDWSAILDFTSSHHLPVHEKRLDAGGPMLRSDRTYWMVGLSGALGISLCDWMIGTGARRLVLSSRNPQIELAWIESHRERGIEITIIPCDITDREGLAKAHATIVEKFPPIAGVLNGAMVLRDSSIRNMTFTQFDEVIRPKVLGSLHLDHIFSSDQPPLDFFLLLSSINCIIGNQGQANYAAANTFLGALAASRRQRGLAGISLNVGAIIGIGYIQRSSKRVLDLTVSRGAMMHLSEEDFHQLIAEAIAAGRPVNGGDEENDEIAELTTGLLDVAHDTTERPVWFSDPKFTHLIVHSGNLNLHAEKPSGDSDVDRPAAIKERLRICESFEDQVKFIQKAFAATLRHELQMANVADEELMNMRGSDIGLDSLVSVDIRTWFLRTLSVSISVLQIMGNDTMASLVHQAAESLPQELRPAQAKLETNQDNLEGQSSLSTTPKSSISNPDFTSSASSTSAVYVEDNKVDWEAETRPPSLDSEFPEQLQSLPSFTQALQSPPRIIVLTGATSLLGKHLLNHLHQLAGADLQLVCIATRQLLNSNNHQAAALPSSLPVGANVKFYTGEISLPNLGLSPSDSLSIFASADAVIHIAADTSHLKPYATLRNANVGSTSELARLCLPRRIPLHFISSAGVGLFSPPHQRELWPAKAPGAPSQSLDGVSGYTASKWACERLLERTSKEYGLPVWIHRPSTIVREGADAEGEKAKLDWMNGLMRYVKELRAVPEVKYLRGALDMVFVQSVCETIGRCVLDGADHSEAKEGELRYVHEVGDVVVPLDRMQDLLKIELEFKAYSSGTLKEGDASECAVLPMAEWIAKAVALGLHPAVAALIEGMDGANKPHFPRLIKS